MDFALPRFQTYRERIRRLPAKIERDHIQTRSFLLERDGTLAVYYAPFQGTNGQARILLVGLTPGWTQTKIAYERCRAVLRQGGSDRSALAAVRRDAPFARMRERICLWLDDLGVDRWLDIESSESLFTDYRRWLQTTSLIRYPVFEGSSGANYRGRGSSPITSELLKSIIDSVFVPQVEELPEALIVPMGVAVSTALGDLGIEEDRCLYGFPHPSRAYPYGDADFRRERSWLRSVVARLPA